jgi:hypothetical protein
MKKGIITVMAVIFIFGFIGCVTYEHTQAVRNETGYTVTEVYIRDTGTTDWGSIKNVQARYSSDGSFAYWGRADMNNGTQIVFFRNSSFSETPEGMRNQDIAIRDSNGLLYMKHNIPIIFSTAKLPFIGPKEALTTSTPITFTVQDRLPMLFVVNQTGYEVTLIAPVQDSINNQGRTQFQPMEMNRSIDVTYKIGQAQYSEQVTMENKDATVTLTKRPPTITIVNNVGSTINTIFLRIPGSPSWEGGNIVIRNGTVHLAASGGSAQTGDISGSIVNKDSMKLWLGNVNLTGNIFDIRIDDVQTNSYVKSNVQITNDMTLTFTQTDKR